MRALLVILATLSLSAAASAADRFECSQIPHAQAFIDGLQPGPNTRAAQQHLDAAKKARSDRQCIAELKKVDYYARRSAAADKHAKAPKTSRVRSAVPCADALHQDRPGGTDYRGRPVPGCSRRNL